MMMRMQVTRIRSGAKKSLLNTLPQPSSAMLTAASVTAMTGVIQKMVANGLVRPSSCLIMSEWVSAQRRPPRAEATKTSIAPGRSTAVVLNAMRTTPAVMRPMTETSFHEKASSRNRKAKKRTKMRLCEKGERGGQLERGGGVGGGGHH